MVFGNEAPVAAVSRHISVVSEHEVVVLLEGVGRAGLPVNEYRPVRLHLEAVPFVVTDTAMVECHSRRVKDDLQPTAWNEERPIVVLRPRRLEVHRIYTRRVLRLSYVDSNGTDIRLSLEAGLHRLRQREVVDSTIVPLRIGGLEGKPRIAQVALNSTRFGSWLIGTLVVDQLHIAVVDLEII